MQAAKRKRIENGLNCHKGANTLSYVLSTVLTPTISKLPSRVIAEIGRIRHDAYCEGKKSGLEVIDGCIYIDDVGLIPLSILGKIIKKEETIKNIVKTNNPSHSINYHTLFADSDCTKQVMSVVEARLLNEAYYIDTQYKTTYVMPATQE